MPAYRALFDDYNLLGDVALSFFFDPLLPLLLFLLLLLPLLINLPNMAASPQCRLIDAYVPAISPEATEMQVLALGMPRTGSTCQSHEYPCSIRRLTIWLPAMHYALEMLGYKPFHMRQFARNPDTTRLWVEALKAKYHGEGKKFGTPELKKLLAGYNVCLFTTCFGPHMVRHFG